MKTQQTSMSGATSDKDILQDLLTTEKQLSGFYDTAIMECANENVRCALQHIQDEEQKHGKMLFDAMKKRGYYKPQ